MRIDSVTMTPRVGYPRQGEGGRSMLAVDDRQGKGGKDFDGCDSPGAKSAAYVDSGQ